MFVKQIVFLALIVVPTFGNAQIGDVINRDHGKRSTSTPMRAEHKIDLNRLARSITDGQRSEEAKSKAIFNWIAANIAYDHTLHTSKTLQKEIYTSEANVVQTALKRKKALCGGYAMLFRDLCAEVGIKAEIVHGYTKLYNGQARTTNKVNHTWNSVKINGQWKLLDITWAKSHSRNARPNLFWYHTSPNDFIKTHYPENKQWTLQRNPISLKEFDKPVFSQ